ncbi:MAG: PrsW family glutamic-type intramembrane protease [Spirochaetes bacterium]|nr:PrsW family glutamic-type intramembrane protease [Spirochaetota bacterium]
MGNLLINVLISVLSGIIIFVFLLRKRNLKPEEILIPMIAGLCAVFPASLIGYLLLVKTASVTGLFKTFIDAFVIASFVEESVKFLTIKILFSIRKIDNLKDGIAVAVAVGTGFACLENIMYSFDYSLIVIFRVFSAVPLHIITAGIIGYFCIKSIQFKKQQEIKGFGEAFLIHGLYNFLISLRSFISFTAAPLLLWAGYRLYRLCKEDVEADTNKA